MVLGVVVSNVGGARGPLDDELALLDSVLDPPESHVICLGALDLVPVIGKAFCCGVVSDHGGGSRLFMA